MRVGIIEDQQSDIDFLTNEITNWCSNRNRKSEIITMKSEEEFNSKLSELLEYDILFFDIHLSEENPNAGLMLAEKIRKQGFINLIVFVTSHSGYAIDSISAEPVGYLVKPFTVETLRILLDKVEKRIQVPHFFTFLEKRKERYIPFEIISYFEAKDHKVMIHTVAEQYGRKYKFLLEERNANYLKIPPECYQKEYWCTKSIQEILPQVECIPNFVQISRKIIANVNNVNKLDSPKFVMADGNVVHISNSFLINARKVYFNSEQFQRTK